MEIEKSKHLQLLTSILVDDDFRVDVAIVPEQHACISLWLRCPNVPASPALLVGPHRVSASVLQRRVAWCVAKHVVLPLPVWRIA